MWNCFNGKSKSHWNKNISGCIHTRPCWKIYIEIGLIYCNGLCQRWYSDNNTRKLRIERVVTTWKIQAKPQRFERRKLRQEVNVPMKSLCSIRRSFTCIFHLVESLSIPSFLIHTLWLFYQMWRYELQERGLMNKEEVQVVPDIYIRLVIIYFVSIKIKGNALYQQERQSLKWGKIIVVVLRDCITLNLVFF